MNFLDNPEIALQNIVDSIRLDETRLERMKTSFKAMTSLLASDKQFFAKYGRKIDIYAQGSASIGTTIKPKDDDFDLDIVLHIDDDYKEHTPAELYNNLLRVFRTSELYKNKYEAKNRCVRINYKNDFHLDVLPGFSDKKNGDTAIRVPDKQKQTWALSNPKGFTEWFLSNASHIVSREDFLVGKSLNTKEFERLNDKPLKDAVMVLKMFRNEYFQKDEDNRTPSIILTTLAAMSYKGSGSILGTLKDFSHYVHSESKTSGGVIKIKNPALESENLSERWEKDRNLYREFLTFLDILDDKICDLEIPRKTVKDFSVRESVMKSLVSGVNFSRGVEHYNALLELHNDKNDIEVLREIAKPQTSFHRPYLSE